MPLQLSIKYSTFTFVLFPSGQFRFMGRVNLKQANCFLSIIKPIYRKIISPLTNVSETCVYSIDSIFLPINMHKFAKAFSHDKDITYEPEIFPALCITKFSPLHINIFTSGKVIVLGYNAHQHISKINDWLYLELLLL